MLHSLTIAINFMALMMALWLGLYLVTRSPHRPQTWLSALALWSMGGYFLNQLLALNPPPTPSAETWKWLYHLILFWPQDVFELGWQGWLQGWLPSYGVIFWYHATLYMLPGESSRKRLIKAFLGYAIALAGITIKARYASAWVNLAGDPLYSSSLSGPFFPLFTLGFVTFAGLSIYNLAQTARTGPAAMPRKQFRLFIYVTLFGGATGLLGIASGLLNRPFPQALAAFFLSGTLLLAGIGVARYSALLDRRPMQQDFLFSAAQAGAVLLIYMLFHWVLSGIYTLPAITFVFVGCLAVVSHLLIDVARLQLDRLYFQSKNRRLRPRLRQVYGLIGNKEGSEVLETALETLNGGTGATWAVVVDLTAQRLKLAAAWNWTGAPLEEAVASLDISGLLANDLVVLNPGQLPAPLDRTALLLPLYQQEQLGVLLVGPSRHQAGYSEAEIGTLQDAADFLAGLLRALNSGVDPPERLAEDRFPAAVGTAAWTEEIPPRLVELALRNLHDYSYLADLPLTNLRLVRQCLESPESERTTHFDRGKAVSVILTEAVFRLKPAQDEPRDPPPRIWYPYIILRAAYLEDEPNREIISRLYISEGTFNRTRRAAIRSVARVLMEMEAHLD